jgi:hypothetical protein
VKVQRVTDPGQALRDYFDALAPDIGYWRKKNRFYYDKLEELVVGAVPPSRAVLDIGAQTGEILAAIDPSDGIGLNLSQKLTERARKEHPGFRFETFDADAVQLPDGSKPDYIVSVNLLDHAYDVYDLFKGMRDAVSDDTLVLVTTSNPLWSPIFKAASRFGGRVPDSPRNYITNRDIASIFESIGLDVVEQGYILPVPRRVPLLGPLLNTVLPEIPVLRYMSSTQYLAARPRIERAELSVSVIVPCHNEEGNVLECARRVLQMGSATEIIFVDDGSDDDTRGRVLEAMSGDPRVRLVAYDTNHGKANAVRAGFDAARNDVVMILDADMTVPPEDLPKFLAPLQAGTADFVNGTRLVYPMHGTAMPMANFLGNKAFCFLVSWVMRQRVSDTLCGTKALLRRDYDAMPLSGRDRWGDFDLLFGAARMKLRVREIPVHYRERVAGDSKMKVRTDGPLFLRACMAGWRMLRRPAAVPWSDRVATAAGAEELGPDAKS